MRIVSVNKLSNYCTLLIVLKITSSIKYSNYCASGHIAAGTLEECYGAVRMMLMACWMALEMFPCDVTNVVVT